MAYHGSSDYNALYYNDGLYGDDEYGDHEYGDDELDAATQEVTDSAWLCACVETCKHSPNA